MPCTTGRKPLVQRGTIQTLNLDPATRQRMDTAADTIRDTLGMHVTRSAIVRRAVAVYLDYLATNVATAAHESPEVYAEGHKLGQAIRGSLRA